MNKKQKDQTTEQKILEAARAVFMEQGMAGARMQDIADKAGINKALLHYYFRNKNKLFEVIFLDAAARFMPRVSMLFESEQPLFDKIRAFTTTYMNMLSENPYLPTFILTEMHKQDGAKFLEKIWGGEKPPVEKLAAQVRKEAAKGIIKPINPLELILNMVSMCVFPFAAKPMAKLVFNLSEAQFKQVMEQRKTSVAQFIIDSIRK